jgi:hypothetical protein
MSKRKSIGLFKLTSNILAVILFIKILIAQLLSLDNAKASSGEMISPGPPQFRLVRAKRGPAGNGGAGVSYPCQGAWGTESPNV